MRMGLSFKRYHVSVRKVVRDGDVQDSSTGNTAQDNFENLCVARCRHDYGLRTSLAEEVKGQMSIVTVFTRRFGPI